MANSQTSITSKLQREMTYMYIVVQNPLEVPFPTHYVLKTYGDKFEDTRSYSDKTCIASFNALQNNIVIVCDGATCIMM